MGRACRLGLLVALSCQAAAATPPVPSILDPAHRRPKWLMLEVTPYGGTYLGRSAGSTFITGAKAALHLGNVFSVAADYGWSRLDVGTPSPIPAGTDPNLHLVAGELGLSNDVAMRLGSLLVAMDLYLSLGAGAAHLEGSWHALGVLGGGVRFYTGLSWLALRVDVNTYLHSTTLATGDDRVDADISVALGVSLLLPPRSPGR